MMLLRSLRDDVRSAARWLVLNTFAGSVVVPRAMRAVIYRCAGIRLRTANVRDHCVIGGRARLEIGPRTFVNRFCSFDLLAPITVGADCQIGPEVMFCTSTHAVEGVTFSRQPHGLPVVVGDRCWLGARATLLPGARVGDGCIVAAGAVVTGQCEPGGLYVGVPARRVRDLDPQERAASAVATSS